MTLLLIIAYVVAALGWLVLAWLIVYLLRTANVPCERTLEIVTGVDGYRFSRAVGPWVAMGLRDKAREQGLSPGSVVEVN